MKSKKQKTCDLCGQEIEGAGVQESFEGEDKVFCGEDCARAYRDMHEHTRVGEGSNGSSQEGDKGVVDYIGGAGHFVAGRERPLRRCGA